MGHLAVTDVGGRAFFTSERFAREAVGLAGAETEPLRVWMQDWFLLDGPEQGLDLRIEARGADASIGLDLESLKPYVLQGDRGLSAKGPETGNASYYYSLTRMRASGEISTPDGTYPVEGLAWFDREWSTSALASGVVGWDWFSLQLDDGRDVMLYLLRREDGTAAAESAGVLVGVDGSSRRLSRTELGVEVRSTWRSPHSGATYPSSWQIALEDGTELEITPFLPDQEWNRSVRYWEGAVEVRGRRDDQEIRGAGYVELTGYGPEAGAAVDRHD